MSAAEARLAELAKRIHDEADRLAYPAGAWVEPVTDAAGQPVHDVVIVGGGQSGLAIAQGLIRDGVHNILVLDRNPAGFEGPWRTYARMEILRTPKHQVGIDHGLPSLTTRAWYEAKYGAGSWDDVLRVGREDWMDYLRWYRRVLDLPVRNDVAVVDIKQEGRWLALATAGASGPCVVRARRVVLATGFDGGGAWRIPPEIAAALPPERCLHANTIIDFARYRGRRIGILGHGAGAFDAAVAALRHGASTVDLCFRRAVLPTVNPHRAIEFVGFLKDFCEADDAVRWSVGYHFDVFDQPPAQHSFDRARSFPNFSLHAASPWQAVGCAGDLITVRTPQREFGFDDVICATGGVADLSRRPELAGFADQIALWRDRYVPPAALARDALGRHPYLGRHYEFQAREPGTAPWLAQLYGFNFCAAVSMGPHSTSISGHKYSVPRLIRGITRSLFLEQQHRVLSAVQGFCEPEIDWPAPSDDRQAAAE
jgi:cation diffusion facilitator CzcD-associated flavoprotein CzcO